MVLVETTSMGSIRMTFFMWEEKRLSVLGKYSFISSSNGVIIKTKKKKLWELLK